MKTYEYQVCDLPREYDPLEARLNELGAQGWRIITFNRSGGVIVAAIFERERA